MTGRKMGLGQVEIDLEELGNFVYEAKKDRDTSGREPKKMPNGKEILKFQKGNFYYEDSWRGDYQFRGDEEVMWQRPEGQLIWTMSRFGGMKPETIEHLGLNLDEITENCADLVRTALLQVTREKPFRGPDDNKEVKDNGNLGYSLTYSNQTKNGINFFGGCERIEVKKSWFSLKQIAYCLRYFGGLIIPKNES